MTYAPSIAEAQAIGLCWLARQPGLPPMDMLRRAVSQLHAETCGWCEYDPADLVVMLRAYHPLARQEADWWNMPGKGRLAAIKTAQGGEA